MEDDLINIESLLVTNQQIELQNRVIKFGAKINGAFLRGPIPWVGVQLSVLHAHKTQALTVYIVVWYLAGLSNKSTVPLQYKRLMEMGVSRKAVYRALVRLEEVGLIMVCRKRGRSPIITLLNPEVSRLEKNGKQVGYE